MENKRPTFVTVICILGFIVMPLSFILALSSLIVGDIISPELPMPFWYSMPILAMIWTVFTFVAFIFIWKMKKVGLIAYTALTVIQHIADFVSSGVITMSSYIGAIILLGLLWTQFKKMSWVYDLTENPLVQNPGVSPVVVGTSEN